LRGGGDIAPGAHAPATTPEPFIVP